MTRALSRTLSAALLILLATSGTAFAWGPTAHRLVNNWAVETLPPDIRGFFAANRQFLIDHANDPDAWMEKDRYERKRHYMYLDKYGMFPYLELPHNFKQAVEKLGGGPINRNGLLPWHVGEYSLRLTNALKAQKWDEAKELAAALGHYVADTHDPLHTTSNYDGQLTGQTGLSARFGVTLMDRFQGFFIFRPARATKIEDPTEHAFDAVLEANTWVDQIVLADRVALKGLRDYNDDYLDRFYTEIGSFAVRELNNAAQDAGSYWYTAWLNAGRPQLPAR
ncbi:MAG: hypothetical protein LAO07_20690 [Acidobacteriia bacterium]|nr:hypothetical protein [Terriglobia bacterium]